MNFIEYIRNSIKEHGTITYMWVLCELINNNDIHNEKENYIDFTDTDIKNLKRILHKVEKQYNHPETKKLPIKFQIEEIENLEHKNKEGLEYIIELCDKCNQEVEIDLKGGHCPICGKYLLPCSQCDMDNVDCMKCKYEEYRKADKTKLEMLKNKIESLDWKIEDINFSNNGKGWELYKYSPAGEDFSFCIEHNNNITQAIKEIQDYTEDFDEEEHIEMWVEARNNVKGVPSIKELVQDAEEIHNMLIDLLNEIQKEGF